MAVTFRSKSAVFNSVGTSPTATEPSGAANGDYIVAVYATTSGAAPTLPAGWTTLYGPTTQGLFVFRVGVISRGGSAPSYAFTHTGSVYRELHVLCFKPASGIVALDSQSSAGSTGNATNHNPDPPATTAVASASLAVACGINWGGSAVAWVAQAGYTIESDNTAGNDVVLSDKSLSSSGSENPGAYTGVVSGVPEDYWDGFTITLTESVAASDTQEWRGCYPPPRQWVGNITY